VHGCRQESTAVAFKFLKNTKNNEWYLADSHFTLYLKKREGQTPAKMQTHEIMLCKHVILLDYLNVFVEYHVVLSDNI
jgi:hypothetical protein